jgi:hypothetical protein
MRAIFAGLLILGGLLLAVGLLTGVFFLFVKRGGRMKGRRSGDNYLRELKREGLLEESNYRALRAFRVKELEEEGSHYFVELDDGSVLYLNGQYLYDFEPNQAGRPRTFPCTEFTVVRHKIKGWVMGLQCRGSVLKPECETPPFSESDFNAGRVPSDGEIIQDRIYEQLKHERLTVKA